MKDDDDTWDGTEKSIDDFVGEKLPQTEMRRYSYIQSACNNTRLNKKYYECREPMDKILRCTNAIDIGGQYICHIQSEENEQNKKD